MFRPFLIVIVCKEKATQQKDVAVTMQCNTVLQTRMCGILCLMLGAALIYSSAQEVYLGALKVTPPPPKKKKKKKRKSDDKGKKDSTFWS